MNAATLDSIRRLAERPGTEQEGIVAREMLKKLESKVPHGSFADRLANHDLPSFEEILREHGVPTDVSCPCGHRRKIFAGTCPNITRHMEINLKIRETFQRGDRVFYNYWAYPPNCPGKIARHVPLGRESTWHWISVKFDHLKNARQVPILNDAGEWCLTKERK